MSHELDEMFAEFGLTPEVREEVGNMPRPCCGRLHKEPAIQSPCSEGRCTDERCVCGVYLGGIGPVGCPCQEGDL